MIVASQIDRTQHASYVLRLADTQLVLGHRLSEWIAKAPFLEEELALANMALDLIGQARALLMHAANLEGKGRDADGLAYLRDAGEFRNLLLVEQPNGDFAHTMARQLFHAAWAEPLWTALAAGADSELAGIAAKAEKEATYHLRHVSEWVIRLGDGTAMSKRRMEGAVDQLWPFTGEFFEADAGEAALVAAGIAADVAKLRSIWNATIDRVLREATVPRPGDCVMQGGGRDGRHSEHLAAMLADMQVLQRTHPGAEW